MDPKLTRRVIDLTRSQKNDPHSPQKRLEQLTRQEKRALQLCASGMTNKEISASLNIGLGTARNYLSAAFEKLNVKNRSEAAALWARYESEKNRNP